MDLRKNFFDNIENLIIILLLFFTSLYNLGDFLRFGFIDEILFCLLFLVSVLRNNGITIGKTEKYFISYLIYALFITIINFANIIGFAEAIPFNIKVPLVFVVFGQLKMSDERKNKLFKIFLLINIPSILRAIWQYNHRSLGWLLHLKMRNGTVRVMGYSAHPIWFAFSMIILIIIVACILKFFPKHKIANTIIKTIIISLLVFLIYASQTRYAIAVLILVIYCWMIFNIQKRSRIIYFLMILCGIFAVLFFGVSVFEEIIYNTDSNAVRTQGFLSLPKAIYNYPFGSGIGTFGNKESILYNSDVYSTLGMNIPSLDENFNSGNLFESTFVQRIVETGILGTILYMLIFLYPLKWYKTSDDVSSFLILIVFALNSIMNVAYQLPLVITAGIAFSNILYNSNAKNRS